RSMKSSPHRTAAEGTGASIVHAVVSSCGACAHDVEDPVTTASSVQELWSSHEVTSAGGGGLPDECQPPLMTPTPGSETITEPSSLTVPGPMLTNCPRSWSKE